MDANITGITIGVWLKDTTSLFPHYSFTARQMVPGAHFQHWGDFGRNFWFYAKISKSNALTVRNAIYRIRSFYGDTIEKLAIVDNP